MKETGTAGRGLNVAELDQKEGSKTYFQEPFNAGQLLSQHLLLRVADIVLQPTIHGTANIAAEGGPSERGSLVSSKS